MRKHFNKWMVAILVALTVLLSSTPVFAAELIIDENTNSVSDVEIITDAECLVETITLDESIVWNSDIPADLGWKTSQDKGQWIEELGIAKDAKSLILVLNNLDKEDADALPILSRNGEKERLKLLAEYNKKQGNSRLMYFSKNPDGEWMVIFTVDCYISGGEKLEKEAIYGAYSPVSTFGKFENPGSLLPYKKLLANDYWTLDMEHESYGSIYSMERPCVKGKDEINLDVLKTHTNFGMILEPEDEFFACPHLIISCQQTESKNCQLSGIQMPQEKLRMMIQSIDTETRFVIAESIDELNNL